MHPDFPSSERPDIINNIRNAARLVRDYKHTPFYEPDEKDADLFNDIFENLQARSQAKHEPPLEPEPEDQLLTVKPAVEWLSDQCDRRQLRTLFGDFWYEGELCILFADTNLGKSILAVQIANNLACGNTFGPFSNERESREPVLYMDFEMGTSQFESRYHTQLYGAVKFAPSFYRAEFNPMAAMPQRYKSFDEYLYNAIEGAITQTGARVLVIDNLTYMRSGTERAKDALPLMKQLKALKSKYNLSVLALAHTPKRSPYKAITVNDLQGSKMLINFCDSAFALGESHTQPGTRYLKQIKQRSTKKLYGADNVCLCHIERQMNFLMYKFDGFGPEADHLKRPDRFIRHDALRQDALKLRAEGKSIRQIGFRLRVSGSTAARLLAEDAVDNAQTEGEA